MPRPRDSWSANPYPPDHPKFIEFDAAAKQAQRQALLARFRTGKRPHLRLSDYAREPHHHHDPAQLGGLPRSGSTCASSVPSTPPRRRAAPEPCPPSKRTELQVALDDALTLTVLHGGATLWISRADGSIDVRNGFTGAPQCVIPPPTAPAPPSVSGEQATAGTALPGGFTHLLPFGRFVVGCHAVGQLRVFDAVRMRDLGVAAQVPTSVPSASRSAPVAIVAAQPIPHPTAGSLFTAASDGTVTLWVLATPGTASPDDEPPTLTAVLSERVSAPLSAAAVVDGGVLLGTADGRVLRVDLEDMGVTCELTAAADGKASVAAIVATADFVVVGMTAGRIVVFAEVAMSQLRVVAELTTTHHDSKATVVHLLPDPRTATLWSVASDGDATCWHLSRDLGFAVLDKFTIGEGRVVCAELYCHADTMRLWTIAGSGTNLVWLTEFVRSMCDMSDAVEDMEAVLQRDAADIEAWDARIRSQSTENERRRQISAASLERRVLAEVARAAYWRLHRFCVLQQGTKRTLRMAAIMCSTCDEGLLRVHYMRLLEYCQQRRVSKQRLAIASNMLCCTDRGLLRVYLAKLRQYYVDRHAARQRALFGGLVRRSTETGLRHVYFRNWQLVADKLKYRRKRQEIAEVMLRGMSRGLQQLFWMRIQRFAKLRKAARKRAQLVDVLCRSSDGGLLMHSFRRLVRFAARRRVQRVKAMWTGTVVRCGDAGIRGHYLALWTTFAVVARERRLAETVAARTQRVEELSAARAAMQPRLDKTAEAVALRERVRALRERNEALLERQKALLDANAEMRVKLDERRKRDAVDASLRDELMETMHNLKAHALSFSTDAALIQKTLDKAKAGAAKVFLAAHMDVKRLVVQVVGENSSGSAKWPLGDTDVAVKRCVNRFPTHSHPVIVGAIKTMVIAFDLLSQKDLDALNTDEEIVANADALIAMFDTLSTLVARRKNTS